MKDTKIVFNPEDHTFTVTSPFPGYQLVLRILKNLVPVIQRMSLSEQRLDLPLVFSQTRVREIVATRQIIMGLFSEYCGSEGSGISFFKKNPLSLATIGGILGGHDHTTVLHSVNKFLKAKEEKEKSSFFSEFVMAHEKDLRKAFDQAFEIKDQREITYLQWVTVEDLEDLLKKNQINLENMIVTKPFEPFLVQARGKP